jgi:hypothetical protein
MDDRVIKSGSLWAWRLWESRFPRKRDETPREIQGQELRSRQSTDVVEQHCCLRLLEILFAVPVLWANPCVRRRRMWIL